MSIFRLSLLRRPKLLAGWVLFLVSFSALSAKLDWEPVDAADRQATACAWYPGADAEALLVRVVLVGTGNVFGFTGEHYKRFKIYTAKGVEDVGVFSIVRLSRQQVWDHAARVTKPDGTSKEYGKDNFSEIVEAGIGNSKAYRLKLAVPDLAAGDIVEIKWRISQGTAYGSYIAWDAQLNVPVRRYTFGTEDLGQPYSANWFNVNAEAKEKKDGVDLVLTNLPPFKAEPLMPPPRDVRGWFMIFFSYQFRAGNEKGDVLKDISRRLAEEFLDRSKPEGTVKAKAAELAAGATTDDEKLRRFYEFSQQHVENFDYMSSAALQAAKKKLGDDQFQSPKQTLARGTGDSSHVNGLFASLARAAGYEVAIGPVASRHATLNVKRPNGWMFLTDSTILVKVAGQWRCFTPGDYFVPYGMLSPSNIGAPVLVCLKDKYEWIETPIPAAEASVIERNGRLTVDADGTLEGEVEITMTGYAAVTRKAEARSKQQEEIDTDYRKAITEVLPTAEISDLAWENLTGLNLPLKVRYKLKVPGYAETVGTRLVVPLDYFTHNQPARFTAATRQFPIVFWHPVVERDNIQLTAAEGFNPDAPSAPHDITGPGGIGCTYRVSYSPSARLIDYRRELVVCSNKKIGYLPASYPALKQRFDAIKFSDSHTLVFVASPPAIPAAAGRVP